ncbi:MAG: hypothetical protein ABFD50_20825 [Smithella sp.]
MMNAEEWVLREDSLNQKDRIKRLLWLVDQTPSNDFWIFHGGFVTKSLFEEARYCFVYGQYLATITLGLSFLEHTMASIHYATGRDDLERASISSLMKESLSKGWINKYEYDHLEKVREYRNRILHFRNPGDEDTIEFIAITENESPYSLLEIEAHFVMKTIFHFLSNFSERF